MAEAGNNYPERRDVLDRQRVVAERQRKQDIAAIPAASSGGGGALSWTSRSQQQSNFVQDPASQLWYFCLDPTPDEAIEGDAGGFTVTDHLGLGKNTLLVPPEPGAYALGFSATIWLQGMASAMAATEYFTPAIRLVSYDGVDYDNWATLFSEDKVGRAIVPVTLPGFAAQVVPDDGVTANDIVGISFVVSTFGMGGNQPTTVKATADSPVAWAYKVG
jgi:hypothetical protein